MAAKDGVLIETISKQVFEDMNKLIVQLTQQIQLTEQLSVQFKKIVLPSQTAKAAQATGAALKETTRYITNYDKSLRKLNTAEIALAEAMSKTGRAIARVRVETQQQNKLNKESAIITSRLSTLYQKEEVRLTRLSRKYADLALKKQLNGKLSKKEELELRRTKRALDKKYNALKKVDAAMGRHSRNVGNYTRRMRGLASSLMGAFGVVGGVYAFAAVLRSSLKTVREYEKANATLAAVLQLEKKEMTDLTDESIRLGASTVKSAVEVVGLQVAYARLGFSMEEIIALTEATIEGSIALNAELDQTALLAGAMVNSFDEFSALDAPIIMDILSKSTARSALNFSKLAVALPIVGGAANALNVPFTEVVATLGKLADAGIETSTASTALRNIFIESAKRGIDYREALDKIRTSTNKLKTANEIFGKRAAISAVTISKNTEAVDLLDVALQNAAGTAADMAAKELDTLDGSIKLLDSAWKGLIITEAEQGGVVDGLKKGLKNLAENLEEVVSWIWFGVKAWVAYKVVLFAASLQARAAAISVSLAASAATASAGAATIAATAWARLTAVMKANALGIAIVGITLLVGWLNKANASTGLLVGNLSKWSDELLLTTQKNVSLNKVLSEQSDRYDTLIGITERSAKEQAELDEIILLLTRHVPDAASEFDEYGKVLEVNTDKVRAFTAAQADLAFSQANRDMNEAKATLVGLREERDNHVKLLKEEEDAYIKGHGTFRKTGDLYEKITTKIGKGGRVIETVKDATTEQTIAVKANRVEVDRLIASTLKTIETSKETLRLLAFEKLSREEKLALQKKDREENTKQTNTLADLRIELKDLKVAREKLDVADKEGIKTSNAAIKAKQKEIDAIVGTNKSYKALKVIVKNSIADYERYIKKLKETQTQTVVTAEEFARLGEQIKGFQGLIDELNGSFEILDDTFKDLDFEDVFPTFDDPDDIDFGEIDLEDLELQMDSWGESAEDAEERLLGLRTALSAIEDVAGGLISSGTLDALWDGFEDGTLSAKEALVALGHLAMDVIREIERVNKEALAERLSDLQLEKEVQLKMVGDNELAQDEIKERFAIKEKRAKEESLKDTKTAATIAAGINAALAITRVFATLGPPANFIVAGVVAGLTAYQIGNIQSAKVPAFEQGTRNAPGGTALVNERRNEVIVSPGGEISRPQGRNQLVHLEKGSHVYRSESEFDRELGGLLGGHGINSFGVGSQTSPSVTVKGNSLTKEDMTGAFKAALKGRATNHVTIDKNGIGTYSVSQMNKTNRLNNRVTFKGKSV